LVQFVFLGLFIMLSFRLAVFLLSCPSLLVPYVPLTNLLAPVAPQGLLVLSLLTGLAGSLLVAA
jgi:hypothetical protein